MSNVGQERVAGADRRGDRDTFAPIGRGVTFDDVVVIGIGDAIHTHSGDHLRVAVVTRDEVAVGVGPKQRNTANIEVGEPDAEDVRCLCLDLGPSRHAAGDTGAALNQLAGRDRAIGSAHILA